MSRLTKRAEASLGVTSGQPVWLQVKSAKNRPKKKLNFCFKVYSEELKELFQMTSFAMSTNTHFRHNLNGTYFANSVGSLLMVATDGLRLAMHKKEFNTEADFRGIIPRKTCIELMKILPKKNYKLKIGCPVL